MILFIDFDGVTHPDGCFDVNFFCRLPLIEEVVREFPPVKIVISSSWRDHYSLGDMIDFFASDRREEHRLHQWWRNPEQELVFLPRVKDASNYW